MPYCVNINIADIWSEPKYDSERITQALFNEPIELLEKGKEYSLVRLLGDGYEGYIGNNFFSDDNLQSDCDHIVSASIAIAYMGADQRAQAATILSFASKIKVEKHLGNFVLCKTARYGDIYLDIEDLVPINQTPKLSRDTIPIFIDCIRRFVGAPYLWGGKSFFGFDCSGLIQTNMKFFGVDFPRDTKDQIKEGREVSRDEIKTGDLLFFDRHVALAISNIKFIHSSLSQGGVYLGSFDTADCNYLKDFDESLKTVRRIIED